MKKIVNLVFILISFNGVAQDNFEPFSFNKYQLFIQQSANMPECQEIRGYRIDSVKTNNGVKSYYFQNSLMEVGFESYQKCYKSPLIYSIMGKKCDVDTVNGIAFFYNYKSDTIRLRYKENIGNSWVFFKDSFTTVKAKVLKISQEKLFNGNLAGVLTIQLNTSSSKPNVQKFDSIIKIADHFGFINTPCLLDFPYYPLYNHNYRTNLLAMESKPVWLSDIYNFEQGDYFEYSGTDVNSTWDIFKKVTVLEKRDTLNYLIKVIDKYVSQRGELINIDTTIEELKFSKDTMVFNPLKKMPGEATFRDYGFEEDSNMVFASYIGYYPDFNKAGVLNGGRMYYKPNYRDSCWESPLEEGDGGYDYIPGLGIFKYYTITGGNLTSLYLSMVYYKKGNETWGKPLKINGPDAIPSVGIFPNPARNQVTIKFPDAGKYRVGIFNISGQKLQEFESQNEITQTVSLNLPRGIYYIKMQSEGLMTYQSKLFLE